MTLDTSHTAHRTTTSTRGTSVNPSATIRALATQASTPEAKALFEALAAEFETQHNQQNNNWQITFGKLQNAVAEEMKALRFDLGHELGQREAREREILTVLGEIQVQVNELI